MVAYNFKSSFVDQISARTKRQTVRHQGGKRHARPGERVQLYTGLRTRHARKIIPDPVCIRVAQIVIPVGRAYEAKVGRIELDGIPLADDEMEAFAWADGFLSLRHFGRFWLATHGEGLFTGVVIYWADA